MAIHLGWSMNLPHRLLGLRPAERIYSYRKAEAAAVLSEQEETVLGA
ncbi:MULTISPECIES: hypothetical protein [unclassified Mesorhizobium]|nr:MULTISPECIES: hypothetical protein [unclassified Mesorhizobium]MDG4900577.1 hypothetical protein [Mesorhizobium sp. WSM4962]MDG4917186.1 hypothetical protein [Mesorhizobium sp. WSM4989]